MPPAHAFGGAGTPMTRFDPWRIGGFRSAPRERGFYPLFTRGAENIANTVHSIAVKES